MLSAIVIFISNVCRFYINDRTWKYTLKLDGCKLNKSSTAISKCPVKILTRSKGIPGNESTDNMIDCSTVPHKHCYLQVLRPLADESQYISFVTNSSVVVGFYLSIVIHGKWLCILYRVCIWNKKYLEFLAVFTNVL